MPIGLLLNHSLHARFPSPPTMAEILAIEPTHHRRVPVYATPEQIKGQVFC